MKAWALEVLKDANEWIKGHPAIVAVAIAALIIGVIIGARH